jgi:hypothetical protein
MLFGFHGDEFFQPAAGVFVAAGEEHYLISLQSAFGI